MTTREVLVSLRDLLSDPKRWTKCTMARDAKNFPICATSEFAVCWCMAGGISKITNDPTGRSGDYIKARDAIAEAGMGRIATLNDQLKHEEVLYIIDRAIRRNEDTAAAY